MGSLGDRGGTGAVGAGCFSCPSPCPSYADVLFVTTPSRNMLEFNLRAEKLILFSPKAPQVKAMVDRFIMELRKVGGVPRGQTLPMCPCLGGQGGQWRAPCKWDHAFGWGGVTLGWSRICGCLKPLC